jgi:anti-sigma regulatory factor (Ser/Thr protein kinase)
MSELAASVLAKPQEISALTGDLLDFLKGQTVDARTANRVALIVEEMLTNLGMHGACTDIPAGVTITVLPGHVNGEIVDQGLPFDPRSAPAPDLELALEARPIGGLGLYLMRQFTCSLDYSRRDGQNRTAFSVARMTEGANS